MPLTLTECAKKHGGDKGWGGSNFTPRYAHFLNPRRDENTVKNILEIGIAGGASLRMWKEFFPNAQIHGIDLKKECLKYEEDRIHIWLGDQKDVKFLKGLGEAWGPFDFIVDDGSHRYQDQLISFKALWPYLRNGGVYAIEDTAGSYAHGKAYPDGLLTQVKDWVDAAQFRGWTIQGWYQKGLPVMRERDEEFARKSNTVRTMSPFDEEVFSVYVSLNLVIVEKA